MSSAIPQHVQDAILILALSRLEGWTDQRLQEAARFIYESGLPKLK